MSDQGPQDFGRLSRAFQESYEEKMAQNEELVKLQQENINLQKERNDTRAKLDQANGRLARIFGEAQQYKKLQSSCEQQIERLTTERDDLLVWKDNVQKSLAGINECVKRPLSHSPSRDSNSKRIKPSIEPNEEQANESLPQRQVQSEAEGPMLKKEETDTAPEFGRRQGMPVGNVILSASLTSGLPSRSVPTGPRAHSLSRNRSPSRDPRKRNDNEPVWRREMPDLVFKDVRDLLSMFLINTRDTSGSAHRVLEMHLCHLLRNAPEHDCIIKHIDEIAIGSFVSTSRPKKCIWALLHSKKSDIGSNRCECYRVLPSEWSATEMRQCGWIVHVDGVDTGFLPRTREGVVPSRLDYRKEADSREWQKPTALKAQHDGRNVRWIYKDRFT